MVISDLELEAIEPPRRARSRSNSSSTWPTSTRSSSTTRTFSLPSSDDHGATRAYRLLSDVMCRTERAALGSFVMRAKEYLAIVRQREGVLTLTTMRFADQIRDPKDVNAATQKRRKPTRKELETAVAVIEELSCEWKPEEHQDRYRAQLKRVVDRKRKGETIKPPARQEQPFPAPDLMAALERILEEQLSDS